MDSFSPISINSAVIVADMFSLAPPKSPLHEDIDDVSDPAMEVALDSQLYIEEDSTRPTVDFCSRTSRCSCRSTAVNGKMDNDSDTEDSESDSEWDSSCSGSSADSESDSESPHSSPSPSPSEQLDQAPFIVWKTAENRGVFNPRRPLIPVSVDTVHYFNGLGDNPKVFVAPEIEGAPSVHFGYFRDTASLFMYKEGQFLNLTEEMREVERKREEQKQAILLANKRKREEEDGNEDGQQMKRGRFEEEEPSEEEEPERVIKEEPI